MPPSERSPKEKCPSCGAKCGPTSGKNYGDPKRWAAHGIPGSKKHYGKGKHGTWGQEPCPMSLKPVEAARSAFEGEVVQRTCINCGKDLDKDPHTPEERDRCRRAFNMALDLVGVSRRVE